MKQTTKKPPEDDRTESFPTNKTANNEEFARIIEEIRRTGTYTPPQGALQEADNA